jgi:poly(3-hydroxybutyrate) depolymerase
MKTLKLFGLLILLMAGAALFPAMAAPDLPNGWSHFVITDFDRVHSRLAGDPYQYLIFGNIATEPPAPDLPQDLAVFAGRWEGVDVSPPVKNDLKMVLVIRKITAAGGEGVLWGGANLQYPMDVKQFHFNVVRDEEVAIESKTWEAGNAGTLRFSYDPASRCLRGGFKAPGSGRFAREIILSRKRSFTVCKDYPAYLESKHIHARTFRDTGLAGYGRDYLVYLPREYEATPGRRWPLLFFLCGTGDRGDNVFLLAKASPYRFIRERADLPFIIVAPSLRDCAGFRSFPVPYLEGALREILADYRVDRTRIYLTGISMGGEAVYRLALHHPETFAAIAPLAAALPGHIPGFERENATIKDIPLSRLKNLPIWAIHGADDQLVPLSAARSTVAELKKAGVPINFSVLSDHDHDVWTDTYGDPNFYQWFLKYKK